jgi:uncharacterized membrane protein
MSARADQLSMPNGATDSAVAVPDFRRQSLRLNFLTSITADGSVHSLASGSCWGTLVFLGWTFGLPALASILSELGDY